MKNLTFMALYVECAITKKNFVKGGLQVWVWCTPKTPHALLGSRVWGPTWNDYSTR